jgi:predicted AAA+ superfamily ATPase
MKLEEVILEFQKLGFPEIKEREIELPLDIPKAITVIGLRRTGKTYLLYQTILKLLDRGISMSEIFYINFEDERLENISSEDLSKIVEIYRKYNPESKTMYLFFDEIQAVDGWENFVRRLLERRDVRIYITGSSSKFLSKEIASTLRGRSISYRLFPLSFREFLEFTGENLSGTLIEDERGRIMARLEEYMEFGGFPEIAILRDFSHRTLKMRILQEYLDMIVYKDLVERYEIEKTGAMKALIRATVKNFGNRISINRLREITERTLSKAAIYQYFSYLEDIGFVIPVRKFSYSEMKSSRSIPKIYIIDNGFPTIYGLEDRGRRMENIVAVELFRRKHYRDISTEIHYYMGKGDREVDFVISKGGMVEKLIQVTYDISDPLTKKREMDGLLYAAQETNCRNLTVITWDYESVEEHEGMKVKFIPLWKWLIGDGNRR